MSRIPRTCAAVAALLALAAGCGERPDPVSPEASSAAGEAYGAAAAAATRVDSSLQTAISFGPQNGGVWGPNVTFRWSSPGADAFRWTLLTKEEYSADTGRPFTTVGFVTWADTLTYHPLVPNGGYDTHRPAWIETHDFVARLGRLKELDLTGAPHVYGFGVRAFDHGDLEDLLIPARFRTFGVRSNFAGPRIQLTSDLAGGWASGDPVRPRLVFVGDGIRFEWTAVPGPAQTPVRGYSFAVDDSTHWAPLSGDLTSWPRNNDVWRPAPGPHTFWVKAVDETDFVSVLEARLDVFSGPRSCSTGPKVLVVLDTDPQSLISQGILPAGYPLIERNLVNTWLDGYDFDVFETGGVSSVPAATDLDCATSVVWIHSTSAGDGDNSVLALLHRGNNLTPDPQRLLSSYVASGGNLFLCGIQPTEAARFFQRPPSPPAIQQYPVWFEKTLIDATYLPHWFATRLGIARVNAAVGNTFAPSQQSLRLSVARSALPGTYPDLVFDPLRWPSGTTQGGFGFYDRDVQALVGSGAEVAYTINDTGLPVAVRKLSAPGRNGNVFFLGLHPYFVQEPAFVQLLREVLAEFGETSTGPVPRKELSAGSR